MLGIYTCDFTWTVDIGSIISVFDILSYVQYTRTNIWNWYILKLAWNNLWNWYILSVHVSSPFVWHRHTHTIILTERFRSPDWVLLFRAAFFFLRFCVAVVWADEFSRGWLLRVERRSLGDSKTSVSVQLLPASYRFTLGTFTCGSEVLKKKNKIKLKK